MKQYRSLYALALVASLLFSPAVEVHAQNSTRPSVEVGGQTISNPSSSTALTVPANAQWALIRVTAQDVHVSMDGTAATTSNFTWLAGEVWKVDGRASLEDLRFINGSGGATTILVVYFRQR